MSSRFLPLFLFLAAIFGAADAMAQLQITLSSEKRLFLAHEPIHVRVKIENRSGRDIIMGGPTSELSWLSFELKDKTGQDVQAMRVVQAKPMILKAQAAIENDFVLNNYYPFDDYGVYSLTASAYSSIDKNFYSSARLPYTITEGREVWSEVVGVPVGNADAGARRKYSVLMLQQAGRSEAYIRVTDMEYGVVMNTYSLGDAMIYGKPQTMIDEANRAQIMFMTKPRYWRHLVIGYDGGLLHQQIFENEGQYKPTLLANSSGKVVVRGGVPYTGNEGPKQIGGEKIFRTSDTPIPLPQ